ALPVSGDAREDGQGERGGLARAGGGLADEVAPVENRRDGLPLDGRGLFVAECRERAEQFGAQVEVGERHARLVGFGGFVRVSGVTGIAGVTGVVGVTGLRGRGAVFEFEGAFRRGVVVGRAAGGGVIHSGGPS